MRLDDPRQHVAEASSTSQLVRQANLIRKRRSSSSPPSRSRRRSPTPSCARTASRSRSASCSTSTRPCSKLVAAGYERVDQVEDRGQFAVRGGLLDIYPATEERAVRVELFDIEIESLRWFSTFTQRSLGEGQRVEIAPAAELAAEHRELAEIAALEDAESRPDVAELLPVDRFRELLALLPEHTDVVIAADEDLEPALRDHWDDVCAAFHDTDAHHLYVAPRRDHARRSTRAQPLRLSSISGSQPIEFRAQAAEFAARSLRRGRARAREAHALRLHDASSRGRSAARASAPPTTSSGCGPAWDGGARRPRVRRGQPARRLRRARR